MTIRGFTPALAERAPKRRPYTLANWSADLARRCGMQAPAPTAGRSELSLTTLVTRTWRGGRA